MFRNIVNIQNGNYVTFPRKFKKKKGTIPKQESHAIKHLNMPAQSKEIKRINAENYFFSNRIHNM